MSRTIPRTFVADLKDGDQVDEIFQLGDKQLRPNKNGDLYLLSQLRDKSGTISGLMWNIADSLSQALTPGVYVRIKGKVQQYQQYLQIIIQQMLPVSSDQVDEAEFLVTTQINIADLRVQLTSFLEKIKDTNLAALAQAFLRDESIMKGFCITPAGVKAHHAYQGGLLEHVVNLMDAAERILPLYPRVQRDLLILGIFLHDIGKVREISSDAIFSYTDEGQLLGHLIIAIEMLSEKLHDLDLNHNIQVPQETILRLKHMILSHHGSYEYGSPKLPMTLEAVLLHHLDNIDAKYNEFIQLMDTDPNRDSSWTSYQQRLDRKLFKGNPE
jgi:3'-5' exoribonuclease